VKRKIIEIDRGLCNGCGRCTGACAEGALELDGEGKAVLVRDIYCDGLGACLDVCPTGALKVLEKEAASFDEGAALAHVAATRGGADNGAASESRRAFSAPVQGHGSVHGHVCPGSLARSFEPASRRQEPPKAGSPAPAGGAGNGGASELGQWPIQLHLVSPGAPYFRECDLLVAADCTAFAILTRPAGSVGSFCSELLRGKALVIACPKLDRTEGYVEKLAELLASNTVYSLTVAVMEVPCCSGLSRMVEEAVERSGKNIAVKTVVIGLDGQRK
jgi:NAD-dependent dihydropyrimidine dehydrogenase PreA subunit